MFVSVYTTIFYTSKSMFNVYYINKSHAGSKLQHS